MIVGFLFCLIVAVSCSRNNGTSGGHKVTHKAWFDIEIGSEYAGRIEIGLFGRIVPMTVRNFVNLAQRPPGRGYKGSKIYLVIKGQCIGGGDYLSNDGSNGWSSFDCNEFDDENFIIKHYGAGWVSSNHYGVNGNTSLFLITLTKVESLDNVVVVFGKVIRGMNVVRKIAEVPTHGINVPDIDIIILDCGAEIVDPPFYVSKTDATD